MKQVELTIKFNISEEDFDSEYFQQLKNEILSGKFQRELADDKYSYVKNAKDVKATLTIK